MLALLVGSLLALLGLAYVLMPLLRGSRHTVLGAAAPESVRGSTAVDALREIEFDRETGKLSDEDYAALRATYTPLALQELRDRAASDGVETPAAEAVRGVSLEDAAEALIARVKEMTPACPACGSRPESDARFCVECGAALTD